jgi:phenylacetate-CoA ligase
MIAEAASRLWWRRFAQREACPWTDLAVFPASRPDERRRILAGRLLAQIRCFGRRADALPEWREASRIESPEDLWKVWPSLPIVTKQMLHSRFHGLELQSRLHVHGCVKSTGGSTGEPTVVFHDEPMMRATNAASTYTRIKMGWRPGMASVKLWGSERDISRKIGLRTRLYNGLLREMIVDGYRLTDQTVDQALSLIRRYKPVAIWGFTSMLDFLARKTLALGAGLPAGTVQTAWNGGEMLFEDQVETFRKAFGVPILNRYGGRELSVMACQFNDGGPLVVLRPWLLVEIVNDRGLPASPGESGRLLWTSTVCRGTPFLRYEVGDLGSFSATHQDESGVGAIQQLQGRAAGLLTLPDGRTINCIYWNHLFKEFPEAQQFQVVLQNNGGIKILLKGAGFTPERETELRQILRTFLGPIAVHLLWAESIPLTRYGKLVQVVCEPVGPSLSC